MQRRLPAIIFIFLFVFAVAVLAAARGSVVIREWDVPTPGSLPHDPAVSRDGALWYTGMLSDTLGRLDTSTGKVEDWPSPGGADSRPYGIAATPDGNIWYSESGVNPNTIVCFDPKTKTFESWPIPSGGGVVRHMVSTPEGDLYIACSGKNKVGVVKISR